MKEIKAAESAEEKMKSCYFKEEVDTCHKWCNKESELYST